MSRPRAELADELRPEELAPLARSHVPMTSVQRLGFLLELTGHATLAEPLADWVKEAKPPVAPLRTGRPLRGARRDRKWRLGVNAEVEPDL